MKADDKNRVPKGLIFACAAGTAVCAVISGLAYGLMAAGSVKTAVVLLADLGILAGAGMTSKYLSLYQALEQSSKHGL